MENTLTLHAYSGMHGCTHTQSMQIFVDIYQICPLYYIFVSFEFHNFQLSKNIRLPRNDTIMYDYLEESIEHTLSELFKIIKTKDQLISMTLASVCLRK